MEVVLVHPEIPQNAGNIARTCAATGTRLLLVRPLGFNLSSRQLKRAGLDYWDTLDYVIVDDVDWDEVPCYFFSTHGKMSYDAATFDPNCRLVFGPESQGLSKELLARYPERILRVPMLPGTRSLNLSNTVALTLYEALRQNRFTGLL